MAPKGASEFALGNLLTCDIQGAMAQLGISGSFCYTLSLSVYYVALIKFNKKEKDISNKIFEYMLHIIPNGLAFITTTFLAVKREYGPLVDGHVCWLGVYPKNCLTDPDVECERGGHMTSEYIKWLGIAPFLLTYFLVLCTMMIACHHIIKQKRKADRWRMQSGGQDNSACCCCFAGRRQEKLQQLRQTSHESTGDTELTSSLSPAQAKFLKMQQAIHQKANASGKETDMPSFTNATTSRSGTLQDPLAFNVHQVKRKIRRESMLDRDAQILLSSEISNDKPLRKSRRRFSRDDLASQKNRSAVIQCLLYAASFLLCWIFPLIARIYDIIRRPGPFPVLVLSRFFNPLQGFFFILVYSRPHVRSIQNRNPELNWFQAFTLAFKAGGDNDFGDDQLEVVDRDGIDAPRLRDSERERRQEIVRQQFKRKSVTFKPNSLDALLKKEGVAYESNEDSLFELDDEERAESINRFQASNDTSSKDSPLENNGIKKDKIVTDTVLSDTEADYYKANFNF